MRKTLRGFGRCWKRPHGGWAIAYFVDAVERRESVARALGRLPHEITEQDAKALLEQRLGERRQGALIITPLQTLAEVLNNRIETHRLAGKKGVKWLEIQSRMIATELGPALPVRHLTAPLLKRWTGRLLGQGYQPGTVALRVANLRAAMRLAHRERLIATLPYFPSIRVQNARQGFFEPEQARAVIAALRRKPTTEAVADLVEFEHLTGWRGGEAKALTWAQVDRVRGEIRLADSKNGEGRVLPLVGELSWLLERRWLARKVGEVECPWVFHRRGKPIVDYRHVWRQACAAAGVVGRVPHDFRRSAARDLIDAGVDPQTAMTVTGHRSLSMLWRYRIVDSKTTARALERLQAHRLTDSTRTKTDSVAT